jgi:hypothetical protein
VEQTLGETNQWIGRVDLVWSWDDHSERASGGHFCGATKPFMVSVLVSGRHCVTVHGRAFE